MTRFLIAALMLGLSACGGDGGSHADAGSDATAPDAASPCVGVVCTALDACHLVGTCNPSTGTCSNPNAPDGPLAGAPACSTGMLGVCAAGTNGCAAGAPVCEQNVDTSPETCDGVDSDCNGLVDDGDLCGTGEMCDGSCVCVPARIDDQNVGTNGSAQPMDPPTLWAQTFSAGVSGSLVEVTLAIGLEPPPPIPPIPTPGDLTISIRGTVSGTAGVSDGFTYSPGPRIIPDSVDLATEVVPVSAVPAAGGSITVTFTTPADVTAGTTYAILVSSGGMARHDWALTSMHDVDSYAAGSIFFATAAGGWNDYGYQPNLSTTGGVEHYDASFQTVVLGCP